MHDPLRERYDTVPYRHGAIPVSHPARLAAIARLHGVPTAAPDCCRVLELGCAEGMNLLPLAERFPRSVFLGVDFSGTQIDTATTAGAACQLENARFVFADLTDFEPEQGGFDYVIAHGVYSWVPDEVKDRLLAICARALAPGGVAYASYNTLPGWGPLAGLRKFLLTETAREQQPQAQIEHARRVLTALYESLSGQPGAYAALLRQSLTDMLQKTPALLYHDELAPVNDPCTFTAFTAHAATHDLHFLAEAHYATMPFEHVPAPVRAALVGLDLDFLRGQQFMDVIFQRWLRNTLLCRAESRPQRIPDPRVIRDCALGLSMRFADGKVNLGPGAALRFVGQNDLTLSFDQPVYKAVLAALAQVASARVPFYEALAGANHLLNQVGLPAADGSETLCGALYRLFALDAIDLVLTGDGEWLRSRTPPRPSTLMQYQARHDFAVTNRWHEPVTITGGGHQWITDPSSSPNDAAMQAGLLV